MSDIFLSQKEVARRWGISPRTLERWRWIGAGPKFLKLGSRVVYRFTDVQSFELDQIRECGPTAAARAAGGSA
jgi:transposase-like protein